MDILLGRKNIEECIKKTTQENLYVLTGGTIPQILQKFYLQKNEPVYRVYKR